MNILVSFFDKNGNEIFNADRSETSFVTDSDSYQKATKDQFNWDVVNHCIENDISWESSYVMGSSVRIQRAK